MAGSATGLPRHWRYAQRDHFRPGRLAEAANAVSTIWSDILGTTVDPSWQVAQQAFLATGGTLSEITSGLANSPEAAGAVSTIWSDILGTAVDPSWQAAQQLFLATGGTLDEITAGLAGSPEAASVVDVVAVAVAGQTVPTTTITAEQSVLGSGGNIEEVQANLGAAQIDSTTSTFASQLLGFIIPSANAAPVNSPHVNAFFNAVDAPLSALAAKDGVPSSWLIGLAAYESAYLNPHDAALNNPLGLTQGGGNNLQFQSIQAAIDLFDSIYSSQITGATSPQDFAQRLEGSIGGAPVTGWSKYNSVNLNWERGLTDTINSIPAREAQWLSTRNSLVGQLSLCSYVAYHCPHLPICTGIQTMVFRFSYRPIKTFASKLGPVTGFFFLFRNPGGAA